MNNKVTELDETVSLLHSHNSIEYGSQVSSYS